MSDIEFVDFDPREGKVPGRGRQAKIESFAQELRDNPGRWAKYPFPSASPQAANHLVWRINSRRSEPPVAFRGGGFEAAAKAGVCYVRYVGDQS